MRFLLKLHSDQHKPLLPVNYQYPLSAVIYKILANADAAYAAFLHDTGYRKEGSLKAFKLFTFSDLKTPFTIQGDRLLLLTPHAELQVCFHLPQASENFVKGLFMNQRIEIADKKSRVAFSVTGVEALPNGFTGEPVQEMVLQPLSPVVCGIINENKHYTFLSPEQPEFIPQLMHNWKEKYKAVYGEEHMDAVFEKAEMEVLLYKNPPKSRLIWIKAGTEAETKIRGFVNFRLSVKGMREAVELLLNAGAGVYNAQGMGCVGVEHKN
ncbi:MAG: CRISPR-associated endoribonuclease Cas6 [Chitinophagaceae bacterium]|nr:CRISPR-associated endoribonuclease Cas6 [Chitinophagaceae bacterium]